MVVAPVGSAILRSDEMGIAGGIQKKFGEYTDSF